MEVPVVNIPKGHMRLSYDADIDPSLLIILESNRYTEELYHKPAEDEQFKPIIGLKFDSHKQALVLAWSLLKMALIMEKEEKDSENHQSESSNPD